VDLLAAPADYQSEFQLEAELETAWLELWDTFAHVLRHAVFASEPALASADSVARSHRRQAPSLSAVQLESTETAAVVDADPVHIAAASVPETRSVVTSLDALAAYIVLLRQSQLLPDADLQFMERCVFGAKDDGQVAASETLSQLRAQLTATADKAAIVLQAAYSLHQEEEIRLVACDKLARQQPSDAQQSALAVTAESRVVNKMELFDSVCRIVSSWRDASPLRWLLALVHDMHSRARVISAEERSQLDILILELDPRVIDAANVFTSTVHRCYPELYQVIIDNLECQQTGPTGQWLEPAARLRGPAGRALAELTRALFDLLEQQYLDLRLRNADWAGEYVRRLRQPPPPHMGLEFCIDAALPGSALPLARAELTHLKFLLRSGDTAIWSAVSNYQEEMERVAQLALSQSQSEELTGSIYMFVSCDGLHRPKTLSCRCICQPIWRS
jgi:predicted kinase